MNLPNKLTVMRVVFVPVFVAFLLLRDMHPSFKWIALAIFITASFTDLFDGYIARKYNLVTNFGKFMDPLADKLLVCSALICLTSLQLIPAWAVIIIIAREFVISGFRLIASDNGVVIAASMWGKVKTVCQMIMVGMMIGDLEILAPLTMLAMWVAVVLTVISLVDYLVRNWGVMRETK